MIFALIARILIAFILATALLLLVSERARLVVSGHSVLKQSKSLLGLKYGDEEYYANARLSNKNYMRTKLGAELQRLEGVCSGRKIESDERLVIYKDAQIEFGYVCVVYNQGKIADMAVSYSLSMP